ncbi:MAG: nuclear transport factor 2 family protein [Acidimicrobiia bacterium]
MDRHFAAENAHDVEGTLATYTDDIVWDDVTHPEAPFHGKEEVGKVYSSILDAIPDVVLESVRRFTGEDGRFVVDESLLTGHVQEEWSGMQGGGAPVEVRILHIFELRDGLICYENAWFDASAVQRQILEFGADSEGNRGGIATTQTLGLGRGPLLGHLGSWAISRK